MRVSAGGVLDTSFGAGGYAKSPMATRIWAVAARPDGSIIGIGDEWFGMDLFAIFLVRYTSAGVLDTSFGSGGYTTTQVSATTLSGPLAFQTDGDILVAGFMKTVPGTALAQPVLARYSPAGILDPAFGDGGIVLPSYVPGDYYVAADLLVQSTGSIVGVFGGVNAPNNFVLQRFTPSGALDTSFGGDGGTTTPFFAGDATRSFNASVVRLPGDALSVLGTVLGQGPGAAIGIARYTADGVTDTSFATGGMAVTTFPNDTRDIVLATALGPQGLVFDGLGERTAADGGTQWLLDLGRFGCP
jgi:uncharacterized delta-60 repeat protein